MRYAPESLVAAPRVVPTMRIWTPASGRLVVRSITRPTMVPVLCASAGEASANAALAMSKRRTTNRMSVLLLNRTVVRELQSYAGTRRPECYNLLMRRRRHFPDAESQLLSELFRRL